jgi:dihydrofolate reductase
MTDLTADLFVSVDGFASGTDVGPFFGYGGPELETWVRETLDQPHVVIMGRVTYEAMAAISAAATDEISVRMTDLPKVVVSNTLTEPLAWRNTRLLRGDLALGMRALKQESDTPLRSIGSITLVKAMMELGLVDRLRLTIFPLTLGADGRDPAYSGYPRAGLDLVETKVLDSRLVMLTYRPGNAPAGA